MRGGVIFKTSQEIQDELSATAAVSLDDIARQLVEIGYDLGIREDGVPAWLMVEDRS